MQNLLKRTILIAATFFAMGGTQAFSGTSTPHLQPEEGMFGFTMFNPYYEAVSGRLLSSTQYRKCQVIFLPSFSQESAVYIEYKNDNSNMPPTVVTLVLEKQLWAEMHKLIETNESYSISAKDQRKVLPQLHIAVNRFEAPIEKKVAITLEKTWVRMLALAHSPENAGDGLDGETYHFANFTIGYGYRTGKVWSPNEGTPAFELVELAKALREYPHLGQRDRKKAAQSLLNGAQNLLRRLKNN